MGVVEISTVVDGCLLGGRAAKDFRAPGVARGGEVSYPSVLQCKECGAYRWLSKWITLMGP